MSLFGGETFSGTENSDIASDQSQDDRSSPSVVEVASPTGAQNLGLEIETDDDEILDSDSSEDSGNSSEEVTTRPNRFSGPPQTWRGYTAADRQIAASLDQLRDSNLAAHLYNAHALKRRARRPANELAGLKNWQSRDAWLKPEMDLKYTDASGLEQTELVPSKDWTAWPLDPTKRIPVPNGPDTAQGSGTSDEWNIGGGQTEDTGAELREEMMAVFLRIAKDNWRSKETHLQDDCSRERTAVSRSRSRSKSVQSVKSDRLTSQVDPEMKTRDDDKEAEHAHVADDTEGEASGKKRGRKAQTADWAKATFLADDAIAHRLLQPSINSMLSKLDELAIAVQRTRLNHLGHGQHGDRSSQSDFTSAAELTEPESRSTSPSMSRRQASESSRGRTASRTSHTVTKGVRGRSEHREETDYDSVLGDDFDTGESRDSQARKRARSASTTSTGSGSTTRDRARAGLMDWSEILGLAALKGWDSQVIARTAQRCATLFGEEMSFMPLDADASADSIAQLVQYTPATIPSPQIPSLMGNPVEKRPFFHGGTLRCPHEGCFGHGKDFALPYRVVEHCIRVHGYDPRTNDESNETRTVGGVQIDGFLQQVTVKPGWLGHGRSKASKASKKQKVEGLVQLDAVKSIEE